MTIHQIIPIRTGKSLDLLKAMPNHPFWNYNRPDDDADVVCVNSNSLEIREIARSLGYNVVVRPDYLGLPETRIEDVLSDHLNFIQAQMDDWLVVRQITYPFAFHLSSTHLTRGLGGRRPSEDHIASIQLITPLPHDSHPVNTRRYLVDGTVIFDSLEARKAAYNKQLKAQLYHFGGLFMFRVKDFLQQDFVFPYPSLGVMTDAKTATDIDSMETLKDLTRLGTAVDRLTSHEPRTSTGKRMSLYRLYIVDKPSDGDGRNFPAIEKAITFLEAVRCKITNTPTSASCAENLKAGGSMLLWMSDKDITDFHEERRKLGLCPRVKWERLI